MFMMMNFFSIYIYVFIFQKILFSINGLENKVPFIVFIKYWSLTVYKIYIPKVNKDTNDWTW